MHIISARRKHKYISIFPGQDLHRVLPLNAFCAAWFAAFVAADCAAFRTVSFDQRPVPIVDCPSFIAFANVAPVAR